MFFVKVRGIVYFDIKWNDRVSWLINVAMVRPTQIIEKKRETEREKRKERERDTERERCRERKKRVCTQSRERECVRHEWNG